MTTKARRTSNTNEVVPFDADTSFVVLQTGALVHVNNDDLRDLAQRGITRRWHSYTNGGGRVYVAVHRSAEVGAGTTTVAALITQRGPHQEVIYKNGDRFDLRRANLIVRSKHIGKQRDPANHAATMFPSDPARQAAWVHAEIQRRAAQGLAARQARIDAASTDDPCGDAGNDCEAA